MSAQATTANPLTPLAVAIAEEVIALLPYNPNGGAGGGYTDRDLDIPYPVTLICAQLGKNVNTPMAYTTFQKRFLDTGLLKLITSPNNRRDRYVRLGDWLKLKKQTGK